MQIVLHCLTFLLNPRKINKKLIGFIDYERIEMDPIVKGGKV